MNTITRGLVLLIAIGTASSAFGITATVSWDANVESDVTGYNIYYGPLSSSFQKIGVGKTTSVTLSNLVAGVSYGFYATALNTAGLESNPSQQVTFKYDCGNVTVQDAGASGIKVRFNSTSTDSYAVESKNAFPAGTWQTVASSLPGNGSAIEVLDSSASTVPNRVYRVRTTGASAAVEWAGFQRIALPGKSDTLVSIPFLRPPAAYGSAQSVSGGTVQFSGSPGWAANQWVYSSGSRTNTYFLLIRSGVREGDSYTITGNSGNSVTLDLEGGNLTGLSAGDTLAIVPYWTLGTLFPGGKGVNASVGPGSRATEVLMPDLSSAGMNLGAARTYYFWNGAWRQVGAETAIRNDDVILSDMYFWVRQNTSAATQLLALGSVLPGDWRLPINRLSNTDQDNYIALPRPAAQSLNLSGLIASSAFQSSSGSANLADQIFLFDNGSPARNKAAVAVYYYSNGAWRKIGGGGADAGSDLVFSPGVGGIIRANIASSDSLWTNSPNY